jgi:DNA-3-methyladenine glycosylase
LSLSPEFFDRSVHVVARELIGCELAFAGVGGVIVETESYDESDPACHAFNGRTPRNEVLFGPPGIAYVYFSYGVHNMLNAVCEPQGTAAAVLIRALAPTRGLDVMRERRGRERERDLCSGPGKLTQALGISLDRNGSRLTEAPFEISERSGEWLDTNVTTGPRIGITRGTELPWRFCAAGSPFVSR